MSRIARIFGGGRDRRRDGPEGDGTADPAALAARLERLAALPLWTDSHCHVQSSEDLDLVLERARESGTRRLVLVGTDETTSRAAVSTAGEFAGKGEPPVELWATVGLHPHDASTGLAAVERYLRELYASGMQSKRVVAVGECGLDFHYDHSPREVQRQVFASQVALAREFGLALVVHTREAWTETFSVLDEVGAPDRLVFHCFTGGPEEAKACLDRGAYVSFSGIVTFPKSESVREAASLCPLDRMLVETDAPFLTPVPHRGKANEPAYVPLIGAAIASLKDLEPAEVAQATTSNSAVVFDLHG